MRLLVRRLSQRANLGEAASRYLVKRIESLFAACAKRDVSVANRRPVEDKHPDPKHLKGAPQPNPYRLTAQRHHQIRVGELFFRFRNFFDLTPREIKNPQLIEKK